MNTNHLLTDTELRVHWFKTRSAYYVVEEGTYITPSARDFLREHNIELRYSSSKTDTMTVSKTIPQEGCAPYKDAETGEPIMEKGEDMTHLRGNLLVCKSHPRIALRGKIDSLTALILLIQSQAEQEAGQGLRDDLQEILSRVREILASEVKGEPVPEHTLLGLDNRQLREASQNVRQSVGIDHPIPQHTMSTMALQLNFLRTQIRETELAAVNAFKQTEDYGIVQALNRLSSAAYLMFCRVLAGSYNGRK
jgi:ethanolamine utilization cobalamin adenosyltransferase